MTGKKNDDDKARTDLLPPLALLAVSRVLTYGAVKYGDHNWRAVPNARTRYIAAALRHIFSAMAGSAKDEETGESHYAHAAACLLFIVDFEERSVP